MYPFITNSITSFVCSNGGENDMISKLAYSLFSLFVGSLLLTHTRSDLKSSQHGDSMVATNDF